MEISAFFTTSDFPIAVFSGVSAEHRGRTRGYFVLIPFEKQNVASQVAHPPRKTLQAQTLRQFLTQSLRASPYFLLTSLFGPF